MYKKHFTFFSFLKYREIITVKSLTSKKKKLGTNFVLIAETNQDFIFAHTRENSKMFNIISECFIFFNKKPPAS